MLTPEAELLGANEVVGSNLKFQEKYKKKLAKQLENGEITSDEMAIKMAKNAKSQKSEGIVDGKNSTQSRVSVQGVESLWDDAGLFWQIGGHSSRFVLFCSF